MFKGMVSIFAMAAVLLAGAASASAATWTFNVCTGGSANLNCDVNDGTDGNVRTFVAPTGEVLTARGFTTANDNGTGNFQNAFLGQFTGVNGGLGVTSADDGSGSGAGSAVDNFESNDLVVFRFPDSGYIPLSSFLNSIHAIFGLGGDTDLSAFVGGNGVASLASFTGLSYATLVANGFTEYTANSVKEGSDNDRTVLFTPNLAGLYLIIGAQNDPGDINDSFKIRDLSAEVPEPASLLLLGSGLLAVGMLARRKLLK